MSATTRPPRPIAPGREAGWDELVEARRRALPGGMEMGRVALQLRGAYGLWTASGELEAVAKRSLGRTAEGFPVIGDWVAFVRSERESEAGRIESVLERRTKLSRKAAGERSEEQVVAANVDRVFVVMGMDGDFNLRRLERFLVVVGESGAEPVVLLSKMDLVADVGSGVERALAAAPGVPVVAYSARTRAGLEEASSWLEPARTVALVGSSGVGKSTLVNLLAGDEIMQTQSVRERDERGRHTTSHRQLLRLPGGALMVDNPGVREVEPWVERDPADEEELEAFSELIELARECRFRDCSHVNEPGCAVLAAIAMGELDASRVASYRTLQDEIRRGAERRRERERLEESQRAKKVLRGRRSGRG